jgi:hypothetical protein
MRVLVEVDRQACCHNAGVLNLLAWRTLAVLKDVYTDFNCKCSRHRRGCCYEFMAVCLVYLLAHYDVFRAALDCAARGHGEVVNNLQLNLSLYSLCSMGISSHER